MSQPLTLVDEASMMRKLADVRILYTDLDGTLLAKGGCLLADGEGGPSFAVAASIVALNGAGLEVVPVSGRSRTQLIEVVRLLGWRSYIAEAGAVLGHGVGVGAEVIYNNAGWPASILAGTNPHDVIVASGALERLIESFPGRFEFHDPWHTGREATLLLRGCLSAEEAQAVLDDIDPPIGILDNGLVRNPGALRCDEGQRPHAYHLVPRGVSKAQAIALDLAARGLGPENAAAIGDSVTDIEMADSVSMMALVANAFESPGVADYLERQPRDNVYVTQGSRGDGWAEFAQLWLTATGS